MNRNSFEINATRSAISFPARILAVLLLLLVGAVAGRAQTQQQVVFNLNGFKIQDGLAQSGSSPNLLPPAFAYSYLISGTVHGTGALASVIPSGTTLAAAVNTFDSGFASNLQGTVVNGSGTLPFFLLTDKTAAGSLLGGLVSASATFNLWVDASGRANFSITNVSFIVLGSHNTSDTIVFDSGFVTTTAVLTPVSTTGTATSVTGTTATLNASVNPNGDTATAYFSYGLTSTYTNTTAPQVVAQALTAVPVTANIANLTPGTTYHFAVTGSNSTGLTSGTDSTFTTPGGAGSPPTATTGTASSIGSTTATVNGSVNPNGADTTVTFAYGLTASYTGTTTAQDIGSGSSAVPVNAALSSLAPGTLYHFQVTGSNAQGVTPGGDQTFTTAAAISAPTATTGTASSVGINSATLNGLVNPNGADTSVTFAYGLTASYTGTTTAQDIGSGTSNVPVNAPIASLAPGTLYHFQVTGSNSQGVTPGGDQTFTTPASASAPTATTGTAGGIGTSTATLNASVNPNGADTTVTFAYGLTTSYTNTTTLQDIGGGTSAVAVTAPVSGLLSGTLYHFQVTGSNSQGVTPGGDQTFTTAAVVLPTMTTGAAVTSTNAAGLSATVNPNGVDTNVYFEYGLDANYGSATSPQPVGNGSKTLKFTTIVAGLQPATTYFYRAVGATTSGTAYGDGLTFTTNYPFKSFAGGYKAAISGGDNSTSGLASINVTSGGSFSATLDLAGKNTAFAGSFMKDGSASVTKSGFTLGLQLGTAGNINTATATVTGPVSLNFVAPAVATSATASAFTFRLTQPVDPSLPQGFGYGKLTMKKSGSIAFTGGLGDGTTIVGSANLLKNGTWALYVPAYKKKQGSIVGTITFEPTVNGVMDGVVTWFKPVTTGTFTPGAFSTQVNLYGSTYTKPAANTVVITSTSDVVEFNGGDLVATPLDNPVTLSTKNKIVLPTPAPSDSLTMSVNTSKGTFSGTFKDPNPPHKLRKFAGALFQDQDFGVGVFKGTTEAGSVIFTGTTP